MNFFAITISLLGLVVAIGEAFFLLKLKAEPIFFCIKVCPLYCSPRHKRYADYADYEDVPHPHSWHDPPDDIAWPVPYYSRYFYCKPHPTTTTTTTTMKPKPDDDTTYICDLCKSKCNYPRR